MELTRRELLAAFLGAPFAALACRERALPLPPGELAGASFAVGHRLRGGPPPPPSRWESHDVVIAGAGVAGLAAAWRLHRAGVRDVVLFELEPVAGGTARSSANAPWGAHYIIAPSKENVALAELLEEMGVMRDGVVGEEFLVRDPDERLFYRGRWYEGLYLYAGASSEDLRQLHAFEAEIRKWIERRTFTIPVAFSTAEADALDQISMREWLDRHGFTSPRLRWFVEYACRDDYGSLLDDTSAWAGVFYFASREQRPVITWPEGNGRLVNYLTKFAPPRTNWLVQRIDPNGDVIATRGEESLGVHAKRVIFAGPQFVAKHVIPSRAPFDFTYGSWMVANLSLRARPANAGFPPAWDNVLYDSPSLGYVSATHQRGIERGPTTLTYYYALCDANVHVARERLLATDRDQWAEIALADLSRAHRDIRELTTRIDVMRWGHAMVRPRPGFMRSAALRNAATPHGPIHFANTDLSGVALFEEALFHGVRAADEIVRGGGGGSLRV